MMQVWSVVRLLEESFKATPVMKLALDSLCYKDRRIALKAFTTGAAALTINILSEKATSLPVATQLTLGIRDWADEASIKEVFDRFWPGEYVPRDK